MADVSNPEIEELYNEVFSGKTENLPFRHGQVDPAQDFDGSVGLSQIRYFQKYFRRTHTDSFFSRFLRQTLLCRLDPADSIESF